MVSEILVSVPPYIQLIAFLCIGIGFALLVSWLGWSKFIQLVQDSPEQVEGAPKIPGPWDLYSRVITVVSLAFVFVLALSLNTLWSNNQDAQSASSSEGSVILRMTELAGSLADTQAGDSLVQSADDYAASLADVQWPLMQAGDVSGTEEVQAAAISKLGKAVIAIGATGASTDPVWGEITSAMDDLTQYSQERLNQVPKSFVPSIIGIVIVLGIAVIALVAAWLPTRKGIYRSAMAILAAIISLLVFLLVQLSNPYAQAVVPRGLEKQASTLVSSAS